MKNKMKLFGVLLIIITQSTFAGDKGNGGDALVCYEDINTAIETNKMLEKNRGRYQQVPVFIPGSAQLEKIESILMYDLYSSSMMNFSNLTLPLDGETELEFFERLIKRLSSKLNLGNQLSSLYQSFPFEMGFWNPANGLIDIDDDGRIVILPENCVIAQIARQQDKEIFYDINLYNSPKFDVIQKTALLLHEYLILYMTNHYPTLVDKDTKVIHYLTELIMSKTIDDLDGKRIKDRISRKLSNISSVRGTDSLKSFLNSLAFPYTIDGQKVSATSVDEVYGDLRSITLNVDTKIKVGRNIINVKSDFFDWVGYKEADRVVIDKEDNVLSIRLMSDRDMSVLVNDSLLDVSTNQTTLSFCKNGNVRSGVLSGEYTSNSKNQYSLEINYNSNVERLNFISYQETSNSRFRTEALTRFDCAGNLKSALVSKISYHNGMVLGFNRPVVHDFDKLWIDRDPALESEAIHRLVKASSVTGIPGVEKDFKLSGMKAYYVSVFENGTLSEISYNASGSDFELLASDGSKVRVLGYQKNLGRYSNGVKSNQETVIKFNEEGELVKLEQEVKVCEKRRCQIEFKQIYPEL